MANEINCGSCAHHHPLKVHAECLTCGNDGDFQNFKPLNRFEVYEGEKETPVKMSNRCSDWISFGAVMTDHIENYTVKQYGDRPNDQIENWSPQQCIEDIKRRCNRFGTNIRGDEKLDMLKIAHVAQITYLKLTEEENE